MDITQDLYHEVITEEYRHPQNYGKLIDADVVLKGRNSSCGDVVTIYLKLDETKQKIIDIKWEAEGCAISRAAMSVLSAKVMQLHDVTSIGLLGQEDLQDLLGLTEIAEGRVKCLLLGLDTIKKIQRK